MELKENQAALILESDETGEITVNVLSPDENGLSCALCHAIAMKLMNDEKLQAELMEMLEGEEGEDEGASE